MLFPDSKCCQLCVQACKQCLTKLRMLFQTYSNVQLNTQESYGIGFFDIVYYVQKMQYLKHDLKVRERRVNALSNIAYMSASNL